MNLKKFHKQKDSIEMVNLIPMINLIFLLLIFFLLTGVVSKKDLIDIERPESEHGAEIKNLREDLVLTINDQNQIFYDNEIVDLKEIPSILTSTERKHILDVDKKASIHTFNNLMQEMKSKGIKKVFIKVSEKDD